MGLVVTVQMLLLLVLLPVEELEELLALELILRSLLNADMLLMGGLVTSTIGVLQI